VIPAVVQEIIASLAGAVAKYGNEHVCMSLYLYLCLSIYLSVREHISRTTRAIVTNFFVHVAYGRGSVVVRQGD